MVFVTIQTRTESFLIFKAAHGSVACQHGLLAAPNGGEENLSDIFSKTKIQCTKDITHPKRSHAHKSGLEVLNSVLMDLLFSMSEVVVLYILKLLFFCCFFFCFKEVCLIYSVRKGVFSHQKPCPCAALIPEWYAALLMFSGQAIH